MPECVELKRADFGLALRRPERRGEPSLRGAGEHKQLVWRRNPRSSQGEVAKQPLVDVDPSRTSGFRPLSAYPEAVSLPVDIVPPKLSDLDRPHRGLLEDDYSEPELGW